MPQLIDLRIGASKDIRIWHRGYSTLSISATGKTKQGKPVVVYAHVPNYFSNPENIKKAWKNLIYGAGIIPVNEFQKLLDLEDKVNVFVVDYNTLKRSKRGIIPLKDALKHPQTIPFIGGIERAETYLARHKEVWGEKIGILYSDVLDDLPRGCLLDMYIDELSYSGLNETGCFIGLPTKDTTLKSKF